MGEWLPRAPSGILKGVVCVVVWSRLSGKSSEWERGYHQLPQGYYRVVIEATSGKGTEHLNIAVDDVWIGQCERGN